jgi:hypothetical protein
MSRKNRFMIERSTRIPARLTAEQTAQLLGCEKHDISVLMNAKLLKPLGAPVANATKYFARVEIERLAEDAKWLSKATRAISDHWQQKNARRSPARAGE